MRALSIKRPNYSFEVIFCGQFMSNILLVYSNNLSLKKYLNSDETRANG